MSEKHTAAYRIFHYYYKCYMAQHHLYSDDYMKAFGIPTSGDRDVDRNLAASKTLCQLTIADMANHLDNGANLTLEEPSKSVEIYNTVREHLLDWKRTLDQAIGEMDAPIDDLRKLDNLATEVYKVARGYMRNGHQAGGMFGSVRRLGARRAMSRKVDQTSGVVKVPEEHKSITDNIVKETFSRRKNWR